MASVTTLSSSFLIRWGVGLTLAPPGDIHHPAGPHFFQQENREMSNLLQELTEARDAIDRIIAALYPSAEPEPEILLRRSQRNRRSEQNQVVTMTPFNGAPAVPESWTGRSVRKGDGTKNRQVLAQILEGYQPMERVDVWALSRELDPRLQDKMAQKNFQQMVNRMLRLKKVRLKRGKLVMGKG